MWQESKIEEKIYPEFGDTLLFKLMSQPEDVEEALWPRVYEFLTYELPGMGFMNLASIGIESEETKILKWLNREIPITENQIKIALDQGRQDADKVRKATGHIRINPDLRFK